MLLSKTKNVTANLVCTPFTFRGHFKICVDQFTSIFSPEIDLQMGFKFILFLFLQQFLAILSLDLNIVEVKNLLNLFRDAKELFIIIICMASLQAG